MQKRIIGGVAASLMVGATIFGGAAHAAPPAAIAFQNQRLVSISSPATPHEFEPAIKVGPDGTVYVAANHHPTGTSIRTVQLWSAPFGTPLTSDGLLPPGWGGQDVDIAVGSTGNLYDATLYLQSVNNGTGSYGVGTGTCPAGSVPAQMSACYGVQKVDNSHTDRPWIAADGPSTVYVSYHDASHAGQIDVAKSTDAGHTWPTVAEAINPQLRAQSPRDAQRGGAVGSR